MNDNQHIPAGYKPSPLGPIPEDWEVKRLGEIGELVSGLTYSPDEISENGVLVLRSSNIKERTLVYDDCVYVNTKKYNPVHAGDILICVRNGSKDLIGKNAVIEKEVNGVAFGAFMAIFRSDLNSYIFHLFDTDYYKRSINRNLGATINSINGSDLMHFRFPIPPNTELKAIAEILKTWDTAIAKQTALIEQLTLRKRGLMQQLLTGKKRLKGFEGRAFKMLSFDKIAKTINVKAFQISKSDYQEAGKNPIVDQGQLFVAAYSDSDIVFKDVPFVLFGDHTRIIKWIDFPCIIGADGVRAIKSKEIMDIKYLYYLLLNTELPNLGYSRHMSILKEKVFYVTTNIDEQKAIAQYLSNADKEIEIQKQKLASMQEQKKGLMQVLLTGKRRIKT